jgi:hypothetical protein
MKTVISETHTKSTASLQKQVEEELNCTGLEVSIASLLSKPKEDDVKDKKGKKNENTKRND